MGKFVTFTLILLLAACDPNSGYRHPTRPTPVPVLDSVTLNQPFPIRADRASEYIQYGGILPYNLVSEYYPHCIFGLRTIAAQGRTVQPGTFAVTAIRRNRYTARAGALLRVSGGDYEMVMSITELDLHSPDQPEVFRLTCRQLDEPWRAHYVTVQEMQQALGEIFTLH